MNIIHAINNRIKKHIAITPSNRGLFLPIFRFIPKLGPYSGYPIIGHIIKWLAMIEPVARRHTQSYVLNLNEDITDKAQGIILPIDMMKQVIRESRYRVIMDECLCRSAHGCTDFPHDHACIFIGEGSRVVVANGIAREATIEEALAHIDKGAKLGLIGHALWVEFEQYVWGITDEGMPHWLEICFCCACCCTAFKLLRSMPSKEITERFRSIGWKAFAADNEACTKCLHCVEKCTVKAISLKDGHIVIDQDACLGCGFCAAQCPQKAIILRLTKALKGTIKEYFEQGGLALDV